MMIMIRTAQCLTLAAVVKLQTEFAPAEDKKYLADVLFYLRVPSAGSVDADIYLLSELLDKCVSLSTENLTSSFTFCEALSSSWA